jgi:hypothetical protein
MHIASSLFGSIQPEAGSIIEFGMLVKLGGLYVGASYKYDEAACIKRPYSNVTDKILTSGIESSCVCFLPSGVINAFTIKSMRNTD